MRLSDETIIDIDGRALTKVNYDYNSFCYTNANGQLHRIGGPAVVDLYGYMEYWVEGKLHRSDGPAVINSNGTQEYWVDDIKYIEEEYLKAVKEYKLRQLVG